MFSPDAIRTGVHNTRFTVASTLTDEISARFSSFGIHKVDWPHKSSTDLFPPKGKHTCARARTHICLTLQ